MTFPTEILNDECPADEFRAGNITAKITGGEVLIYARSPYGRFGIHLPSDEGRQLGWWLLIKTSPWMNTSDGQVLQTPPTTSPNALSGDTTHCDKTEKPE